MSRVFISSVVTGFEEYRTAAKKAVDLLGHTPVMSETFGARAHSSETACITEVQQCDVYVVVLGANYGYVPEGHTISVTHAEYRAAQDSHRPTLAFVQDVEMEPKQRAFKKEVEAYQSGQFRQAFSAPEELKDGVVKALRLWERGNEAIPAEEFEGLVDEALRDAMDSIGYGYDPRVVFAYLPQPAIALDVGGVEAELDDIFAHLCSAGLARMRDGYENEGGHRWAGLASDKLQYAAFDKGLRLLAVAPISERGTSWGGQFLPPDRVRAAAHGFYELLPVSSGFVALRLLKMGQAFVAENPGENSLQMRGFGGEDDDYSTTHFFNPLSHGAFEDWLNRTMKAIERRYGYPPRSP